jgi:hypothetical protein
MKTKQILLSLGTMLATSKAVKAVSDIELDDVLGTLGLARRRSGSARGLGLLTLGALTGAGAALLLAPQTGSETRRRLGVQVSRLADALVGAVREQKEEALHSLAAAANGAVSPNAQS